MDMLIALYGHPPSAHGLGIRRPSAPDHDLVVAWIAQHFSPGWASEARVALCNRPPSIFVAVENGAIQGFCCYNSTALGFVGPIGVLDIARGQGIGASLLLACLQDMRSAGYGYAIAGHVAEPEFFKRVANAIEIPDSTPGFYVDMLHPAPGT
jgi:GNAT superfamily N-acetyltransferase